MGRKRAQEPSGNPSEEQTAAAQPATPTEGAQPTESAPAQPAQPPVPQVVQNLHAINSDIFELLAMRDSMLEQGRDTASIDALIEQQTTAFGDAMKKIIADKEKNVVVIPTKKEARRKTAVNLLEEIRDKLETSGPAQ